MTQIGLAGVLLSMIDSSDDDDDDDDLLLAALSFDTPCATTRLELMTDFLMRVMPRTPAVRMKNVMETSRAYSDIEFVSHYRLTRPMAYNLIGKFENSTAYRRISNSAGRPAVSAEKHMLIFLYFAGHETICYRAVADRFDVTLNTLFNVITRIIDFLLAIAPEIITIPNSREKRIISQFFERTKRFPGVLGALDGCHITIDRPLQDPVSYYNRKKDYSVHMQAMVDHRCMFRHVYIGYPGSVHDARVFRSSDLPEVLERMCDDGKFILADSAYPLTKNMMTPYRQNGHLSHAQQRFNKRLSGCRIKVEHAFGRLKQRFRQLYHCKLSLIRCVKFIHACCVLHNLVNGDVEGMRIIQRLQRAGLERAHSANNDHVPNPPLNAVQEEMWRQSQARGVRMRQELTRQFVTH